MSLGAVDNGLLESDVVAAEVAGTGADVICVGCSDCGMDESSVFGDVVDNGTVEDGASEADDPDDGGD